MYRLLFLAAVCAVAVSATAVLNATGNPPTATKAQRSLTLRFDEKTTYLKVIDNPPADTTQNPETGDMVLFRADLVSAGKKIGTDQGFCTVVDGPKAECTVTLFLASGHVVGLDSYNFSAKRPQVFSMFGGTGAYQSAHGQARIVQATPRVARWVMMLRR